MLNNVDKYLLPAVFLLKSMNLELYNTVEIPLSILVGFKSYESLVASNTIQAQIEHIMLYSDPKTIHILEEAFLVVKV